MLQIYQIAAGCDRTTTSEVTLYFHIDLFIPHQVTLVDVTYPGDGFSSEIGLLPHAWSQPHQLSFLPWKEDNSQLCTQIQSLHVRVISTIASNPETPAGFSTDVFNTGPISLQLGLLLTSLLIQMFLHILGASWMPESPEMVMWLWPLRQLETFLI